MDKAVLISLIVSLAVLVQCKPDDSSESFDKAEFLKLTGCLEKHGLEVDEVMELTKDNKFSEQMLQDNPKLNCLSSCIFEFASIMDGCSVKDMESRPDTSNENIERALDGFETCKSAITATEPCECGNQMAKCLSDLPENK